MDGTAADQVNRRCRITGSLRPDILLDVQETLHTTRLYVRELKAAYEFANTTLLTTELPSVTCRRPAGIHERTFNAPTVNEVAVLMPNDPVGQRDIIVHTTSNQLQGISVPHKAYDKYDQQLKSA